MGIPEQLMSKLISGLFIVNFEQILLIVLPIIAFEQVKGNWGRILV